MKATLMFPRNKEEGAYFESLAYFAARRARTFKDQDQLVAETDAVGVVKRTNFIKQVVVQEWSLDVAELNIFIYDIESVPDWLMTEFFRHRLIVREWSFEQRSKRALPTGKIPILMPPQIADDPEALDRFNFLAGISIGTADYLKSRGYPPEVQRYAALDAAEVSFVCAGNARALHHLFTMRGSQELVGESGGKASPEFQRLIDAMYNQAREVCPLLFDKVLVS